MAYYEYDDKPRYPSRRDEHPAPRARDFDSPKYSQRDQPVRSRPSVAPADASRDYSYDPRHRSSPPPRTSSFRSARRARPRWPPQPTVENEADSLAKEHGVHTPLHRENGDGPAMRGAVDQEPIMVEVAQPKDDNQERRFVIVPNSEAEKAAGSPVHPAGRTSRREGSDRYRAPPLKTDLAETPIYSRREPSPYAFSKPDASGQSRSSGEQFLSPDKVTPPSATIPRSNSRSGEAARPRKTNPSGDSYLSPVSRQNNGTLEDSDLSGDDSKALRSGRKPARYSFSPADLKKDDLRTSLRDNEQKIEQDRPAGRPRATSTAYSYGPGQLQKEDPRAPPHNSEPSREYNSTRPASPLSSRGNSPPSPNVRSTPRTTGSSTQTTPASQSFPQDLPWARPSASRRTTYDTLYDSAPSDRSNSKGVSRAASPISRENSYPPSPPRSPSLQTPDRERKQFMETRSRPPSRVPSRAPSPFAASMTESEYSAAPPNIRVSHHPRVSTFPIAASTKDYSRRVSSQGVTRDLEPERGGRLPPAPKIDVQSPSPARPAKPATSLPYPVDDMNVMMPQEDRYQYNHDSPGSPMAAGFDHPRAPSIAPNPIPTRLREDIAPAHVAMRRTFSETSVHTEPLVERPLSRDERSSGKTEIKSSPAIKTLPPCPRSGYSSKYDDWYTIEGSSSVNVCLDCLQGIVGRSKFRDYFVRVRRSETARRKTCDLSVPWFRIAWLLTVKENRPNLDLLRVLATIRDQELDCPGISEAVQPWYGVRNTHNKHVSNMFVCQRDARYIEALLPSLRGQFTRVEMADPTVPRLCSLRTESRRFEKYVDLLVEIHDKATKSRRSPDMLPFVELATKNAWKSECSRDTLIVDGVWHLIHGLPELTVCEECYDELMWPLVRTGNSVAESFTRTLQLVPQETVTGVGSSCQLYSPRMRRVFQRAAKDEDLGYLVKKARERKKVELDLQEQHKALRQLLDDHANRGHRVSYSDYHGGAGLDPERIRRELESISREWKDWE